MTPVTHRSRSESQWGPPPTSAELTWNHNASALIRKAQHQLHFLHDLRKNNLDQELLLAFAHSSVESMLSCCWCLVHRGHY